MQLMAFSAFSIVSLALAVLPIIGFWLAYSAAKAPRLPEKTLSALTLFKVSVVIDLVIVCLVALVFLIVSVALLIGSGAVRQGPYYGTGVLSAIGIAFLVLTVIIVVFIIIYYRAILRIFRGIRDGIMYNYLTPLRGVGVFSVLTYIGLVFSIIAAIGMISSAGFINNLVSDAINSIPMDYFGISGGLLGSVANTNIFSSLCTIIHSLGSILCIVVLNRFNNSLKYHR